MKLNIAPTPNTRSEPLSLAPADEPLALAVASTLVLPMPSLPKSSNWPAERQDAEGSHAERAGIRRRGSRHPI